MQVRGRLIVHGVRFLVPALPRDVHCVHADCVTKTNISEAPKPCFCVLRYWTTWLLRFRHMFHLPKQFFY